MKSPRKIYLLLALTPLTLTSPLSAWADGGAVTHGEAACTNSESWTFTGAVFESKRSEFKSAIHGGLAPVRGFAEGLALRRFAANTEARTLGEYWISRSLFDAKLLHIAFGGFVSIASRPVTADTAGIQISALDCLLQIQSRVPSMQLPQAVLDRVPEMREKALTSQMRDVIWQAASSTLRTQLAQKKASVEPLLAMLKGSGPYEEYAIALRASHDNDHTTAVTHLDRFFASANIPPSLKRFLNSAHIQMARDLYSLQQYDRAALHLKQITRNSNELALSLEEMSWVYLMNEHLREAIGTAMNLQAGGLRHTYAPEAPMVMAMALNELCQYPESVRAIRMFKKNYEKSYQWLQNNINDNMYHQAVGFVRRNPENKVPERVASEWVRSPLFLSNQDEINLLFDENEGSVQLGKSGAHEQSKLAESLILKSKTLPKRLREAKAKIKGEGHLPTLLLADLLALKEIIIHYRRLQQGAPVWHTILTSYRNSTPTIKNRLISNINVDLKSRSQRMLAQLDEIAENIQLIEVEIYNGASQDIIWQNAHPDFKKISQRFKDEKRAPASTTLDWGSANAVFEEDGGEVWEDELGSFAANMVDNCSSKDKYAALKMGH